MGRSCLIPHAWSRPCPLPPPEDEASSLAALLVFDSSIDTCLLLVLFDLGVGYAGQRLRHRTMTTRFALETAGTLTERLLAGLQLPMMMALGGALFFGTALLFLFPWLWPRLQAAWDVDSRTTRD